MNKTPSIPAAFKLRLNLLHYMYYLSIVNPLKYEVYRYRDPEYVNSFRELNNKDCVHRSSVPLYPPTFFYHCLISVKKLDLIKDNWELLMFYRLLSKGTTYLHTYTKLCKISYMWLFKHIFAYECYNIFIL